MKTRKKLTAVQRYQKLSEKVSNKKLVDELIKKYQKDTKNAVQNIINMCKTTKELQEKVKFDFLKESDLNYFCATVNLNKNSSTFRKYLCIADKADLFEKYLEKVPASYTILYEITTLDADQFELLIKSKQFNNFITLNDVKKISGKVSKNQKSNKLSLNVIFDKDKTSKESLKIIAECYQYLRNLGDIELEVSARDILKNIMEKKAA
jgi:hypothetical protein